MMVKLGYCERIVDGKNLCKNKATRMLIVHHYDPKYNKYRVCNKCYEKVKDQYTIFEIERIIT